MLKRFVTVLASRPWIYDVIQSLAGQGHVARQLRFALEGLPSGRVLDVGSAAGGFAGRLGLEPVCVDIDPRPLTSLRRRGKAAHAVAGDAALLPFADESFDLTLCVAVSHHLDDSALCRVVAELSRVTSGHLVFLDAVRNNGRPLSRWLWRYDRGSHPRTREALVAALEAEFELRPVVEFSLYHQYILCIASPRSSPAFRRPGIGFSTA